MMTQLLQKHWEWQEGRRPMMRHGIVIRPTMFLASMDLKTPFDVARSGHIAKLMEDHVRGWIVAASLREMAGLEGQATFESVEGTFSFCEMHPAKGASTALAQSGHADLGTSRARMDEEKDGRAHGYSRRTSASDMQFHVDRQLLDHVSLKDASGADDEGLDGGGGEVGPGA